MKEQLISSSSSTVSEDENDLHQFTINEHYAKAFQYRKEREELAKLKEKYGSDADTDEPNSGDSASDSESDESEDEDGEELTPAVDAAILRTLARIKSRDPGIYDIDRNVFEEEHSHSRTLPAPSRTKKAKTSKPVTLQEQRLAAALDVATARRSTSPDAPSSSSSPPPPPTHVAEQAALRAETIAATFHLARKTRDEVEREEAEYRAYLEREVGPLEKILDIGEEEKVGDGIRPQEEDVHVAPAEADSGKRRKKRKGKVTEERKQTDQEFLINYILHRGWIDRSARRLPTYKEITVGATSLVQLPVRRARRGAHPILPRAVESVRRPTEHAERRHAARERRRERKETEKAQRREEVKRLKGLKAREVEAKLERIGKEGGWAHSQALEALDIDGDWDADAYDQQMAAVLAETDGMGTGGDDDKPTWEDDIDIGDIVPEASRASAAKESKKAKKKERKKRMREDEASAVDVDEMDADAPTHGGNTWDEVEWDGTEEMRKHVAGMPTRFRYIPVANTSFGLSASEILLADDKDLNEYRDTWDARRGERLREFKNKISGRLEGADANGIATEHLVDGEHKAKKRKGKKERLREKAAQAQEGADAAETKATDSPGQSHKPTEGQREDEGEHVASSEPVKKRRRRQKKADNHAAE
ncbi:KRI1-like family-domain-containing protein [Russula vinacea]|nr:KRI1-like family-domain-containing protein [Russula vinacea]